MLGGLRKVGGHRELGAGSSPRRKQSLAGPWFKDEWPHFRHRLRTRITVTNSTPNYLRLHVAEEIRDQVRPAQGMDALIAELRGPFEEATGWTMECVRDLPVEAHREAAIAIPGLGGQGVAGYLKLDPRPAAKPSAPAATAMRLATAVADMASRLLVSQDALWKREAELAAGVPVTLEREAEAHLAVRLQSVLRGAVEAVGCQAAGLYLLDADTSELKLRSCWGLPHERLAAAARPLRGAIADLEALLGHAVVLEDLVRFPHWNAPENFCSAVCVPVSTPTVPLGTLWVFCDRARDFTKHQTGMLELAAGRLAADLEREMLLTEGLDGHRIKRQLAGAERLQRSQLPRVAPLVDGWEVAGHCEQRDSLGGDFYDWFPLGRGPQWGIAVGDALHAGVEASLVAATVRAALRAHARTMQDPSKLMTAVNRTLWTSSAGDQSAALACLAVDPDSGRVRLAVAGTVTLLLVGPDGNFQTVGEPSLPLGREPSQRYRTIELELAPGEQLIAYTEGYRAARDAQGVELAESALIEGITPYLTSPPQQVSEAVRAMFDRHGSAHDDRTVLVLRRRPMAPRR